MNVVGSATFACSAPVAIVLAAALLTWALCFPVYSFLAQRGIIDRPNSRSSHTSPTVRGGGLAIIVTILAGMAGVTIAYPRTEVFALAGGTFFLAVLSWIDDIRTLRPSIRFLGQALAAVLFLLCLRAPFLELGLAPKAMWLPPWPIGFAVGFLWVAGYTNAFNFMDGINGISGMQGGLTGIGMGTLAGWAAGDWTHPAVLMSFIVGGAALGFLPHNFPRARMFMGDVSSAPLGFILSALALWLASDLGWWLLIPLALVHANYVLDTAITLLRRVRRREKWYDAHREHFYQRLVRAGKTHVFATACECALQVFVFGLIVVYLRAGVGGRVTIICALLFVWAAFFAYAECLFRRKVLEARGGVSISSGAAESPRSGA